VKPWLLGIGAAVILGVLLFGKKAVAAAKGGTSIGGSLEKAAAKMPAATLAAARKWAPKRELPLGDVLATILLESRGNPKAHAKTAKEDSRGAMQVNVNAHGALLTSLGYKPDDLYDPDKGVEVGTLLLKKARDAVQGLLERTKTSQVHSLDTLVRLYYAGPAYVQKMLTTATKPENTAHVFKNSETYVQHWKDAKTAVAGVLGVG
jgi:soluble lytic murein transglycosylase-like protein